jgi:hypothetical protein
MRTLQIALVALLALSSWPAPLGAQSLADVARAEEARRKAVRGTGKVYTNDDLKGGQAAAPTPAQAPSGDKPATAPAPTAKPETEKPKPENAEPPKDEKYWRGRMLALRQAIERNNLHAEALQSRVNALNTEFANMDDPFKRAGIEQSRRTTIAELERVKQETEKLNRDIAALEDEARRASVPPGWLR